MHIQRLQPGQVSEFRELVQVLNTVFESGPHIADDDHLLDLLADDKFIALAAFEDEMLVGGLTAYQFKAYNGNYSELYIYDIAVRRDQQRKGIGITLIETLKEYGMSHGVKTIFVEAHREDQHALDFYRRTNASAEDVVHFNYDL